MAEQVKLLYTWPSPFAMRVQLALELKGIDYEKIHEPDLLNSKSQLLLESNPVYKKIPVLIHNGKPICESAIILQYIDEVWPENAPLLPADPYERSQVRFWGDFLDKKLFEAFRSFLTSKSPDDFKACVATIENALSKIEEKPFFGGKSPNFADLILAPYAVFIPALAEVLGLEISGDFPNFDSLLAAVRELPASKNALPEQEKLNGFVKVRFGPK